MRPQDEFGLLDLDALLGRPQPDTKVYCCGPEPLLAAVEQRCHSWPRKSLHVERFVAKPLTAPVLTEPFEVYLAQSDLTLSVPPDKSILSAVEDAGVEVLSSCAEGTCGTCETPVLEGVPDHRDSVLDEEERGSGDCMMICISRACTPRLVLDLTRTSDDAGRSMPHVCSRRRSSGRVAARVAIRETDVDGGLRTRSYENN